MAKALLGAMSTADPRTLAVLAAENRRLRERVADLDAHAVRVQAENDALAAELRDLRAERARQVLVPTP